MNAISSLARMFKARSGGPSPLRYRWTAFYTDGTLLIQDAHDRSSFDPQRSSFFDVDQERVERFRLQGPRGNFVEVNLTTGAFLVNGLEVILNDDDVPAGIQGPLRLLFFRRHFQSIGSSGETDHRIVYRIGWQAPDGTRRILTFE